MEKTTEGKACIRKNVKKVEKKLVTKQSEQVQQIKMASKVDQKTDSLEVSVHCTETAGQN